jgi:hypothetical protein
MKERGVVMLSHSLLIGIILYAVLVGVMGVDTKIAENRSIMISGLIVVYMILFGHDLPYANPTSE